MTAPASSTTYSAGAHINALTPFDFHQRTRLIFGRGTFEQLGILASELAAKRVLLVTDTGLRKVGHCDRAVSILAAAGIQCVVFDQVTENQTSDDVDRCVAFARPAAV